MVEEREEGRDGNALRVEEREEGRDGNAPRVKGAREGVEKGWEGNNFSRSHTDLEKYQYKQIRIMEKNRKVSNVTSLL